MEALICGGHTYTLNGAGHLWLDALQDKFSFTGIRCLEHEGVAQGVAEWGRSHAIPVTVYTVAEEDKGKGFQGFPMKRAQMIRELVQNLSPDEVLCIAFPGGTGTKDMVNRARKAHLQILFAPEETVDMPTMIAPPSAPMLTQAPEPIEAIPGVPDDITDPPVPETLQEALTEPPSVPSVSQVDFNAHEALLQGFCAHLLKKLELSILDNLKQADAAYRASCDAMVAAVERKLDTLTQPQQQAPYAQGLQVRSGLGHPFRITVETEREPLLTAMLPMLATWLTEQGCQVTPER